MSVTTISFVVNKNPVTIEADPQMPLLWVLRDILNLTGTKYGCGLGICGACTVHLGSNSVRACTIPIHACQSKEVTTIEGLSTDGSHVLQQAWRECNVPQCGYCQAGQIMEAAAFLAKNASPTVEDIKSNMNDVLCRCGTYPRIRKAIEMAIQLNRRDK